MTLLDAAILMNPQVWVASGHVGGFSDPLIDDKNTKERFRADKLLEDIVEQIKQEFLSARELLLTPRIEKLSDKYNELNAATSTKKEYKTFSLEFSFGIKGGNSLKIQEKP